MKGKGVPDEDHEEVDSEFVLEDVLHVHDEGVVHVEQDVLLQLDVLELLVVNDNVLPDTLHRKDLAVFIMLHQVNLAKGSFPHHLPYHKVLQLNFLLESGKDEVAASFNCLSVFLLFILFIVI